MAKHEEGGNMITLDQDDISNLYGICVAVVKSTNVKLDNPLYKMLLSDYLNKQQTKESESIEEEDDEEEEDKDKDESSEDGSNDEGNDEDDEDQCDDHGNPKKPTDEDNADDDDEPPPPQRFIQQERRIKRKNDKSGNVSGKKRASIDLVVQAIHSPSSLQDALHENSEHQYFLEIGERVRMQHGRARSQSIAIKQMAQNWMIITRVKRYVRTFKASMYLMLARKNKKGD